LCKKDKSIPLFSRDYWLDAVCGMENWDVVIAENKGNISAAFPYYFKKKHQNLLIKTPPVTPSIKIWIKENSKKKYSSCLSLDHQIISQLIDEIPGFISSRLNFHSSMQNWLPFYWKGFKQTTRYTYRIEDCSDLDKVRSNFSTRSRGTIRKAEKSSINISDDATINDFYVLLNKTFNRQNRTVPFSKDLLLCIDEILGTYGSRKILFARDENNCLHAAGYFCWDDRYIYYLLGAGDPDLRSSGAMSLIVWEAIKLCNEMGLSFDFEGSMNRNIEQFFRGFGAVQTPYFTIYKYNSIISKIAGRMLAKN